jgi:hypothetical protein
MAIITVDDLIDALSKFDGSKIIKVQDREIPVIGLNITRVTEDVFVGKEGPDVDIVLINVQLDLDESQGR